MVLPKNGVFRSVAFLEGTFPPVYPIWVIFGMGSTRTEFSEVLAQLEKVSCFEYLFEPGVCVPGLDVIKSPMKEIIAQLEKQSYESIAKRGIAVPGLCDQCRAFHQLINSVENS